MKRLVTIAVPFALLLAALPDSSAATTQKWYERAVKKVEGSFSPAEAKPGQTVTFTLTVELNDGFHTYPTVQSDKAAASMVNAIKFPDPGTLIFVGTTEDGKDAKTKADPDLGITEMRYYEGKATITRKAVVSPKAAAGPATVKLAKFQLSVCDKDNCFPPKDVPVEARLKVLDGPPVEVEKQYAEEVKKALGEK